MLLFVLLSRVAKLTSQPHSPCGGNHTTQIRSITIPIIAGVHEVECLPCISLEIRSGKISCHSTLFAVNRLDVDLEPTIKLLAMISNVDNTQAS